LTEDEPAPLEWLADILIDAVLKMSDEEILTQFTGCSFTEAKNVFMMRAMFEKIAFERQHRLS
jgi:hypothetical protein